MTYATHWTRRLRELADRAGVPGAVLGIWADGEEVLAAYGVLNTATGVDTTTDSLFQIGSITKVWTATMLIQLIEEHRLSLDTPVADVLPGSRLGIADAGRTITVAHLLTHTSGLDGDIFTDTGRGDECVRRYVDELASATSTFPAGAGYSYCNSGFVLAGHIIEVLDGRSWDESLRSRLVEPLGLIKTVTLPEEAILHRAAVGHDEDGPVRVWALPRSVGPAGMITASAHDLLTFARLHLDGGVTAEGKQLFGPDSAAAMQRPRAAIPSFTETSAAIGLGWRLSRWDGRLVIGHDGGTIGQSAYLRIVPDARLAVCLLTNSSQAQGLYEELFAEVFSSELFAGVGGITMPASPRPAPESADIEASLQQHAGRYERTARRYDVSVRDGLLHATATTTGSLAALTGPHPEEVTLHPADSTGLNFLCRSRDIDPWIPVMFGEFGDGTPYLFAGGRIAPQIR